MRKKKFIVADMSVNGGGEAWSTSCLQLNRIFFLLKGEKDAECSKT